MSRYLLRVFECEDLGPSFYHALSLGLHGVYQLSILNWNENLINRLKLLHSENHLFLSGFDRLNLFPNLFGLRLTLNFFKFFFAFIEFDL